MTENLKKIYVLDTSVLIHNPEAIFDFGDNKIIIPIAVLEELDGLKSAKGDLGFSAREASRNLDSVFGNASPEEISSGIMIEGGALLSFDLNKNDFNLLPPVMKHSADNSILLVAIRIKNYNEKARVIVVSKDINLRLKAIALNLEAQDYEADKVKDLAGLYEGIFELTLSDEYLALFYKNGMIEEFSSEFDNPIPNQCFRVRSVDNKRVALARYIKSKNILLWVNTPDFFKSFDSGIKPINDEQILAYDMIVDPNIYLVSLFGAPGTGKTLMSLLGGKNQLGSRYKKIKIFRATKPVGDDIGFLPGTEAEKMDPWARPIMTTFRLLYGGQSFERGSGFDSKGGSFYPSDELIKHGLLEISSMNYVRGDSFHDSFVVIDDAQNLTQHQMKALLTRAGKGSKYILTGDLNQVDGYLDAYSSGLTKVLSVFPGLEKYGQLKLIKGERSELANEADKLL